MQGTNATPEPTPRGIPAAAERPNASLPAALGLPLDLLEIYSEAVLAELAKNRDLRSEGGKPCYRLRSSGEDSEASWLHFTADFSGLGMAIDMPLIVTAYTDEVSLEWNFGVTPIAKTPRSATPKEAADILDMNRLLDAFRRFVAAESVLFPTAMTPPREKGPVFINPEDGSCRECSGELEITGVDDCTMTVECRGECGGAYEVEHDAFDGGVDYVLEYLSRRGSNTE